MVQICKIPNWASGEVCNCAYGMEEVIIKGFLFSLLITR